MMLLGSSWLSENKQIAEKIYKPREAGLSAAADGRISVRSEKAQALLTQVWFA